MNLFIASRDLGGDKTWPNTVLNHLLSHFSERVEPLTNEGSPYHHLLFDGHALDISLDTGTVSFSGLFEAFAEVACSLAGIEDGKGLLVMSEEGHAFELERDMSEAHLVDLLEDSPGDPPDL